MKTLFFLLLSDMFVTVWMDSYGQWCTDGHNSDLTNVTWYCDQANGKLFCKNSSPFPTFTNPYPCDYFETTDVDVVTDQSVLGLQHAGLDHHARSQIYETSCIKEDDEYNEPIRNVTWRLRQENGKLTYQPSLESCYIFSKDIDEDKEAVGSLKPDVVQSTGDCCD